MSQVEDSSGIDQKFLHIKAIEVNFEGDRPRFPVFLKIKVGDISQKSVPFEEGRLVRWVPDDDLHITVPAVLTILVRQLPVLKYLKKDYAVFKIKSSQLIGNDTFSAPDAKGKATVTITCTSALPVGLFAEFLLKEAEGQVGNKKVLLQSLGHASRILDGLMAFSDLASDVHPAVGAAVVVIKALYKKCKAQEDCRQAVAGLVRDLVSFMPTVKEIPQDDVRKTVTRETIKKMLELFCTISESIIKYSSGGILGDLFSDHTEMDSAKAEFGRLKETYDWCIKLETWGSVARAGDYKRRDSFGFH
ncbi:hypothetical protein M0805_006482 [Coniferiporia weirii]|nr:hypothetical protein M0805_006482 [Coniferiporia weirii]